MAMTLGREPLRPVVDCDRSPGQWCRTRFICSFYVRRSESAPFQRLDRFRPVPQHDILNLATRTIARPKQAIACGSTRRAARLP
jgi:hypothetical protein